MLELQKKEKVTPEQMELNFPGEVTFNFSTDEKKKFTGCAGRKPYRGKHGQRVVQVYAILKKG